MVDSLSRWTSWLRAIVLTFPAHTRATARRLTKTDTDGFPTQLSSFHNKSREMGLARESHTSGDGIKDAWAAIKHSYSSISIIGSEATGENRWVSEKFPIHLCAESESSDINRQIQRSANVRRETQWLMDVNVRSFSPSNSSRGKHFILTRIFFLLLCSHRVVSRLPSPLFLFALSTFVFTLIQLWVRCVKRNFRQNENICLGPRCADVPDAIHWAVWPVTITRFTTRSTPFSLSNSRESFKHSSARQKAVSMELQSPAHRLGVIKLNECLSEEKRDSRLFTAIWLDLLLLRLKLRAKTFARPLNFHKNFTLWWDFSILNQPNETLQAESPALSS